MEVGMRVEGLSEHARGGGSEVGGVRWGSEGGRE